MAISETKTSLLIAVHIMLP